MIILVKGLQGKGKTAWTVGRMVDLVLHHGYTFAECVGNVHCPLFEQWGYTHLTNEAMRTYVAKLAREGIRHRVVICDEAARVFPHRLYTDKAQTETLIALWQDEKLFHQFLFTAQLGLAVDKLIRDAHQVTVIPNYDPSNRDEVRYTQIDQRYHTVQRNLVMRRHQWVHTLYDRWEFVQ